jgi:hypothetical protein
MPRGFEPAIPATKRPQTYALDRAASGVHCIQVTKNICQASNVTRPGEMMQNVVILNNISLLDASRKLALRTFPSIVKHIYSEQQGSLFLTTKDILEELHVTPLEDKLCTYRHKLFQHVHRMDDN